MPRIYNIWGSAGSGKTLIAHAITLQKTRLSNNKIMHLDLENDTNGSGIIEQLFDGEYKKNLITLTSMDVKDEYVFFQNMERIKPKVVLIDTITLMYYSVYKEFTSSASIENFHHYVTKFIDRCNELGADVIATQQLHRGYSIESKIEEPSYAWWNNTQLPVENYVTKRVPDLFEEKCTNAEVSFYLEAPSTKSSIRICGFKDSKLIL